MTPLISQARAAIRSAKELLGTLAEARADLRRTVARSEELRRRTTQVCAPLTRSRETVARVPR